jgi:2-keto-4-pentenoate hydratase/2-oxohepta-3-ene-1,7-dioic acid hydratase in catechol pathway
MAWTRLIRFQDDAGATHFGEPVIDSAEDLNLLLESGELFASAFEGSSPFALTGPGSKRHVKRILGILTPEDVPVIKCIGLNYMKHIQEGGRTPPPYPSIFLKARTSIASYDEDVPVPKLAQDDQCDYEGELSIVVGNTGKNIKEEEALDYVAGYVSSNDVSSRKWQRDPAVSFAHDV